MSQTQLGSMFLGKPHIEDKAARRSPSDIDNLFIIDGQTDEILTHINKNHVISNQHEQDLTNTLELFEFTALIHDDSENWTNTSSPTPLASMTIGQPHGIEEEIEIPSKTKF